MFIYSVKSKSIKLYLAIALSALSVVCVIALFPPQSNIKPSLAASKSVVEKNFKNIESSEDRVAFLKQFGWEIEAEATDVSLVTIPVEFNDVYGKYNELQLKEGLDLRKYKGKTVKKYTYLVNNHNFDGVVYANILVYKNRVVGGDISSAVTGGFIHGFTKGNDFTK